MDEWRNGDTFHNGNVLHETDEAGIVFHFYGSIVKCLLKCQMRRNIFIDAIDNNKADVEQCTIFIETVITQ